MFIKPELYNALQNGQIEAVALDMDGVLYCNSTGLEPLMVKRGRAMMQKVTGLSAAEIEVMAADNYKRYGIDYIGLRDTHGICLEDFAHTLLQDLPLDAIPACTNKFKQQLQGLKDCFKVMIATNSAMVHPQRVLQVLGLREMFNDDEIVTLCKTDFSAKPSQRFVDEVVKLTGVPPQRTLFVEDSPKSITVLAQLGFWTAQITASGEHARTPSPDAQAQAVTLQELFDLMPQEGFNPKVVGRAH